MERLTKRINGVVVYVGTMNPYMNGQIPCEVESAGVREMMYRLAAYEDTGLTPEKIDMDHEAAEQLRQLCQGCDLDRLEELAEADWAGRLVVLPCKVGDGLWTFCSHPVEQIYSFTVTDISTLNGRAMLNTSRCGVIDARDVGKTVFLTREEAEAALEAMKDD